MKKSIINKIFWIPNPVSAPKGIKQWSIMLYGLMVVILIGKDAGGLNEILLRALFVIIFFNLIPYQIYRLVRKAMGKKDDVEPKVKEISKSKNQQIGYNFGRKLAPLLIKLKKIDIKKFKLKKLKKEYHIPLAIIFGTIIISLAIYLGSTAEYRGLKRSCITMAGEKYKTMESGAKNIWLTACMSRLK